VWVDHDAVVDQNDFIIRLHLNDTDLNNPSYHAPAFINTFATISGLTPGKLTIWIDFGVYLEASIGYRMSVYTCAVDEADIAGCATSIDWTTCKCTSATTGTSTL
jgi:hypothetical protein